ncbi:MAG: anaerobic carbon-monoxide dehydrogenase catalytic subunit [Lachnospiraceae bacterium]|nr:anaerobic carbon-monoxide dehydrogenase catalytic subunit [Lachnospiraceae bacterium]
MSQKICKDADKKLEAYIGQLSQEVSHHRMVIQQNKCGYGLAGVCCKLCSNGPCRLSSARPRGVCGADADTIVMRNFLRSVAAGSGCYIHVVENVAKQLKNMALAGMDFPGKETLERVSSMLEIQKETEQEKALAIADVVLADMYKPVEEKMAVIEKVAYPRRVEKWKKLGIMPGGAKDEIFNAVIKTSTNLNSDPVDMLMQCLRLGISTGVYGLVLVNLLQDIMMGESELGFDPVGLQVIDPDYINIMITGHQHSLFKDIQDALKNDNIQGIAKKAGAKGFRIVGCTCVGQDFQVRKAVCGEIFCGHAGNNYTSEAVLETGCIDLVVSEFNCTLPGIEPICEKLGIPQICIDDVAKKVNAEYIPYSFENKQGITAVIIAKATTSYATRKEGTRPAVNVMADHGCKKSITGVTEVTLEKFLGGSLEPLVELIKNGTIKGIAGVVGCSNLRGGGHDVYTVELTKELIKNNILVVSAGCTCGGLENCGLMAPEAAELAEDSLKAVCKQLGIPPVLNFGPCLAIGRIELVAGKIASLLGVDIPDLPVVVSAPQWLEEQALADGAFALALGFPLHLGLTPFVTGSNLAVDVLTNQMKDLTGGQLICNSDMEESARCLVQIIDEKRKNLGI